MGLIQCATAFESTPAAESTTISFNSLRRSELYKIMSQLLTFKGLLVPVYLCAIVTLVLGQRPPNDLAKFRASKRPIANSYIVGFVNLIWPTSMV